VEWGGSRRASRGGGEGAEGGVGARCSGSDGVRGQDKEEEVEGEKGWKTPSKYPLDRRERAAA